MFKYYAERNRVMHFIDRENRAVMVSRKLVFEKIAKWYPEFHISVFAMQADTDEHTLDKRLELDRPEPPNEKNCKHC